MSDREQSQIVTTTSADETRALGARIAVDLRIGDVLLLHGDLGSGKTTFTQGLARGLGIAELVQSPTFTLVAEHRGQTSDGVEVTLFHLDLYRLSDEAELESIGLDDYLAPATGISVIEWPERLGAWLPETYLLVTFEPNGEDRRSIQIERRTS